MRRGKGAGDVKLSVFPLGEADGFLALQRKKVFAFITDMLDNVVRV